MRAVRFRQVARLEKLAQPLLKRKGDEAREWRLTLWGAVHHAAVLAFFVRYGDPRVDEPLSSACQRCAASTAWNECRQEFSWFLQDRSGENVFHPHTRDDVTRMGAPLRHFVIASFPGKDEKEKLSTAFIAAPPWLLWYTFADYTAKLLGLTLPDLSKVSCYIRSRENFNIWWGLPSGAFERERWPRGQEEKPLAHTDLNLLRPAMNNSVGEMTRRERMRERMASEKSSHEYERRWPELLPVQVLKLSRRDFLSLNEKLNPQNRDFHHATIGQPSRRFR